MKSMYKPLAIAVVTVTALSLTTAAASAAGRGGNGPSWNASMGNMMRSGGMMARGYGRQTTSQRAAGDCMTTTLASGTLTDLERSELIALTGEEKLAHDVYVTLSAKFPTVTEFARIANSETMHWNAMRSLLSKYGIADPTAGYGVGEFANVARVTQYKDLVAQATDTTSALKVGVAIENLDIADLNDLLKTVTAPDVKQVLSNLLRASQMHLAAFQR